MKININYPVGQVLFNGPFDEELVASSDKIYIYIDELNIGFVAKITKWGESYFNIEVPKEVFYQDKRYSERVYFDDAVIAQVIVNGRVIKGECFDISDTGCALYLNREESKIFQSKEIQEFEIVINGKSFYFEVEKRNYRKYNKFEFEKSPYSYARFGIKFKNTVPEFSAMLKSLA